MIKHRSNNINQKTRKIGSQQQYVLLFYLFRYILVSLQCLFSIFGEFVGSIDAPFEFCLGTPNFLTDWLKLNVFDRIASRTYCLLHVFFSPKSSCSFGNTTVTGLRSRHRQAFSFESTRRAKNGPCRIK